jgi:hypothetical protein
MFKIVGTKVVDVKIVFVRYYCILWYYCRDRETIEGHFIFCSDMHTTQLI